MTRRTFRLIAAVAAGLLGLPVLAVAQDATFALPVPTTAPVVEEVVKPITDATLWRLAGGGEVVGRPIKETPAEVFIDIGPSIIQIPASSVLSKLSLKELEESKTGAGLGSGVFDSETGSLVFRSRGDSGAVLSQQEVLESVKRGVVLVSNPAGLGTGWMIDGKGRLVTNQHVVGDEVFQTVTIFVKNGSQWEKKKIDNCKVEAASEMLDIAVVQLDMAQVEKQGIKLYPVSIASPKSLQSGDKVYAVGNPGMGGMVLDHTISEGIASSTARNFNDVLYLQTTAAVNPGNSGGPLVNERGEVVGLVTLKAIFQEGVAFALPVDYILHFLGNSNAFAISESGSNRGFRYHRPQ